MAGLALGLLVLVWVSSSGPVTVLSGGRRPAPPEPAPTSAPSETTPPRSAEEILGDRAPSGTDLSWIGDVLSVLLLAGLITALLLVGRHLWRERWRRPEREAVQAFTVLPEAEVVSGALARDADGQLAAMAAGTPRNGIVDCWRRLEMAIADAGVPRHRAETSAEFTVRVLHRLDVDPRAIGELAGLYREARFSEHRLEETHREAALAALQRLHADLGMADAGRRHENPETDL